MRKSIRETLKSLGPAFIVASVVLGPGSILSNSYVGAKFGYSMIWLLVLASLMMILVDSVRFDSEVRRDIKFHSVLMSIPDLTPTLIPDSSNPSVKDHLWN